MSVEITSSVAWPLTPTEAIATSVLPISSTTALAAAACNSEGNLFSSAPDYSGIIGGDCGPYRSLFRRGIICPRQNPWRRKFGLVCTSWIFATSSSVENGLLRTELQSLQLRVQVQHHWRIPT